MKEQLWTLRGLNFSYYATSAVLMPFLPIYFEGRGYSSSQIGLLMMIGPFVTIFAQPMWGYLSDRYQTLKLIIFGLWGMTVLSSIGIFTTTSYSFALLFMLLLYFFMLSSTPLLDTISIKSAVQAGVSYGSIRLWGSVGFTLLAVSSGFILQALGGLQNIPYLYWSIWLLPLLLLLFLKDERSAAPRVSLRSFTSLFRNVHFLWFLLLVFLLTIPHRMNDVMFVLYLKDLGATNTMAGWAWAFAAASEIPTFALLGRYMHRFHELALLGIVAVLYTVRWLAYGWITDPFTLMFLQATHSITFAVFWIVAVQYVARLVPQELQSTGQSMLSMVFLGLSGITGGFIGGWIKDEWGGAYMYIFGAGMTCIAAVLLLGTHVYQHKKNHLA
ncbi:MULTISPECIES: MFS transporter [unclassified Paenibacillus]|uniref:MFS transporter n=1 Tax=unclassified Paenibacillus TaxID=185978 RepID=UPI001AE1A2CC|nr:MULTISPECIES: MFS transporter [unclassified Paenibacillus]MBP1154759.1 PPP family 3-phenylpropionic acid transporter [Paenibacillus sp. PvP091]MBP1169857.1 PPP family 3-phenylpropionic acid transporter [Paenibacillus sp. PvR098]MBP2440885.1 PPP family 3-phenylpropionic acid transporter [Paenibacillus sp. PvP052]